MEKPAQSQNNQPGIESLMTPAPIFKPKKQNLKLENKVALITGGDSGIGRAVAVLFASEGADIVISYLNEHDDAQKTKESVEEYGRKCILIPGDISDEQHCENLVKETTEKLERLDIVVNNAAVQFPKDNILEITAQQLETTFKINIFSMFYITKAAIPYLKKGSSIINTTSVTAYRGNPVLIDYSSTKGAIVAFTRSLSLQLNEQGIRVNGVAPGPIWTPLIPATFDAEKVKEFGNDKPMQRPGQPEEVAPCYLFLASDDASYISGQILHPNGGDIING